MFGVSTQIVEDKKLTLAALLYLITCLNKHSLGAKIYWYTNTKVTQRVYFHLPSLLPIRKDCIRSGSGFFPFLVPCQLHYPRWNQFMEDLSKKYSFFRMCEATLGNSNINFSLSLQKRSTPLPPTLHHSIFNLLLRLKICSLFIPLSSPSLLSLFPLSLSFLPSRSSLFVYLLFSLSSSLSLFSA